MTRSLARRWLVGRAAQVCAEREKSQSRVLLGQLAEGATAEATGEQWQPLLIGAPRGVARAVRLWQF